MSNIIATRVWEQSGTKGNDRLLMVCLADQSGDDGISWPGLMNLCRRMGGITKRSVQLQLKRLIPTNEILVYPRIRASHSYIIAVGMSSEELKKSIRKLAKVRKISTLELAKIRRINAGKKTGVMKNIHQGGDEKYSSGVMKNIHQGDDPGFITLMNPGSSPWNTFVPEGDPRSIMIRKDDPTPHAADAARGAADRDESKPPNRDEITKAVIVGSFNLAADAPLDQHGDYLLSHITNWLGVNCPDDTADDVRTFYRWYAEKTRGEFAAPRKIASFSMQYREYKAARNGSAPKPVSTVPTMRHVEVDPGPNYTPEERAELSDWFRANRPANLLPPKRRK